MLASSDFSYHLQILVVNKPDFNFSGSVVCVCVCVCVCVAVCMCACVRAFMLACVCMCMCVYARARTCVKPNRTPSTTTRPIQASKAENVWKPGAEPSAGLTASVSRSLEPEPPCGEHHATHVLPDNKPATTVSVDGRREPLPLSAQNERKGGRRMGGKKNLPNRTCREVLP